MADINLTVACKSCGNTMVLTPNNSGLLYFTKVIGMSYMHCICTHPGCGEQWFSFIDDDPDITEQVVRHILTVGNWYRESEEYPGLNVYRDYCNQCGLDFDEPQTLTQRHEEMIESLRVMLELTPDHHLMDIFSSPPPKSNLPRKWT